MTSFTTSPWTAAVDRTSSKTLVGSRLRSSEWAMVPQALRDRAFFSARVESARILSSMREKIVQGISQARPDGTGMDRARFVADMRRALGAAPGDSGSLTDLASHRRLALIWDFQVADAHAYAAHKAGMDPDVLDAFPAQRLIRIESRRVPRPWLELWASAGVRVGWAGASKRTMVALKTSPIWTAISRFGRPWPPFDFGSGMGLEDVDRRDAEELGLLPKDELPANRQQRLVNAASKAQKDWNEGLAASAKGLSQEARSWLKDAFGDQISIEGDTIAWTAKSTVAEPTVIVPELPAVDNIVASVARASTREEAHAIVALPPIARGSLTLNPSHAAVAQTAQAHAFLASVVHKEVAPVQSCKVVTLGAMGRGYYQPATATATVRTGSVSNTVHEIGHHLETSDPEILAACKAFLRSRIRPGEVPQRLSRLTGNRHYAPTEVAIEDEWATRGGSVYSGKVYNGTIESATATEVLTMGLERLYTDPVGFARQDPEYFRFILNVLRP